MKYLANSKTSLSHTLKAHTEVKVSEEVKKKWSRVAKLKVMDLKEVAGVNKTTTEEGDALRFG